MKKWILLTLVLLLVAGGYFAWRLFLRPSEDQLRATYWAVREGDVTKLRKQISENRRVVTTRFKDSSMLLTATGCFPPVPRQTEVIRILLEGGADANEGGGQPLWGVVFGDNLEAARLLLAHGADPHRKAGQMERSAYEEAAWREKADFVALFDHHPKSK